jgi:hypothetical protein
VLFFFTVHVGDFHCTVAQMQDTAGSFPKSEEPSKPKRLLRFSLSGFPTVRGIPIIDELPQPFDELDFLWLSEDLTVGELNYFNDKVFENDPLHWKDSKAPSGPKNDKDFDDQSIALAAGCHFQLILREHGATICGLDYVFSAGNQKVPATQADAKPSLASGTPAQEPSKPAQPAEPGQPAEAVKPAEPANPPAATSPVARSSKGLSIRNIGFQVKDGATLVMTLDAVATLGPLEFALLGFAIGVDLQKLNPRDLLSLRPTFSLAGMSAGYSKPPTTLAGMFIQDKPLHYQGAIELGVGKWTFLAGGAYGRMAPGGFESAFVLAVLRGPIMTIGFAEVCDIVGGFGYNSALRIPEDPSDVLKFPFMEISRGVKDAKPDVMAQFAEWSDTTKPDAWFKPKQDAIWLAAGKSFL